MAQIFHRSTNTLARVSIFGGLLFIAGSLGVFAVLDRSTYSTGQDLVLMQPVPFSHSHHVAGLGLDCRYCHTTVEKAAFAGIPPSATCMNCHKQIWSDSEMLAPVRDRRADPLDARLRPPRLRLLRSLDPHRQGRRLRLLSRACRSDAVDAPRRLAANDLVPGLPPRTRALRATQERGVQHGLGGRGSGDARPATGRRPRHSESDELQFVS